jgi:hypothetical protein
VRLCQNRLNQLHRRILRVLVTTKHKIGREKGDRKRAVGGEPKLRATWPWPVVENLADWP